jgi:nucleoside-diphosphate-sugar epimerase
MKILVTGASGFTGSHLANALVQRGHEVYGFVRPTSNVSALSPGVHLVRGDLANKSDVDEAIRGTDMVYHIAACYREPGVPDQMYFDVNVTGTRHVAEACLKFGIKRMVHCSTIGVHGHVDHPPANEGSPFKPGDDYQRTKLEAEQLVRHLMQAGLPATIFRPTGIYGPGDKRFLKLFRAIKKGIFIMFGDGNTLYHFIFIDDLIRGIIICGEDPKALGKTYIIAGEKAATLNEITAIIAHIIGVKKPKWRLPFWLLWQASVICESVCKPFRVNPPLFRRRADFFRKSRSFDASQIRLDLQFQPNITLEEGLQKTADWYKANNFL